MQLTKVRAFICLIGKAAPGAISALFMMTVLLTPFAWAAYKLIAPLFSNDPLSGYLEIGKAVGIFGALIGGFAGAIYIAGLLAARFKIFRTLIFAICVLIAIAIAAGAILQIASGHGSLCRSGRYSDC